MDVNNLYLDIYDDKSDDFNETMSINNYLNNMQYNIIFIKVYFLTKKID